MKNKLSLKVVIFFYFTSLALINVISVSAQEVNVSQENKVMSLSLEDITKLAIENNFDIQLAKYDAWIAQTKELSAKSIYDTIFSAEAKYENDQSKSNLEAAGTKNLANDYNIGLSKKIPTGTTFDLDMKQARDWTNSSAVSSALTHDSTIGVGLTQDLGKNFLGMTDRGDVKITLLDIENSEYTSLEKIEQTIAVVQKSYWDLVLQIERERIQEDMVEQAKKLYDLHQEKLKDGLVEVPEAIASEANYKQRKDGLTLVRNNLASQVNLLKLLLNISDDDITINPSQDLTLIDSAINYPQELKAAFENRQDYKRTLNDIKSKDIKLSLKRNNFWPEINLKATFEQNGLGDHFPQSTTNITDENNPYFYAGLTLTMPLENRDARSELKAAEGEKAKALVNLKLLERKITIAIIDQVRNCNVYKEVAASSEQIASLQKQKLEEEEKRFNLGRSNTDTLIRFQEDVIQARYSAAQAKTRYLDSLIDLELLKSTLLTKYWHGKL